MVVGDEDAFWRVEVVSNRCRLGAVSWLLTVVQSSSTCAAERNVESFSSSSML